MIAFLKVIFYPSQYQLILPIEKKLKYFVRIIKYIYFEIFGLLILSTSRKSQRTKEVKP